MAAIFDPITSVMVGLLGAMTSVFGGLFGGLSTVIPGQTFDNGGLASGVGLIPKATIKPELVLSPEGTAQYGRIPGILDRFERLGRQGGNTVRVGDIHLHGSQATPEAVRDRLLDLIDV